MNENIISYCKNHYFVFNDSDNDLKINPQFAILIKGKWGCGKTHVIKNILKEPYSKDQLKEVIWLSVYGLSNIQQVEQKIYELLHPVLSSKIFKFASNLAQSALKINTGIDILKKDINLEISLADITADEKTTEINKLLIIDDIERCSIDPCEILGFVSERILEKNLRVVFIGNTEEMRNSSDEFNKIKEKVIGMEFEVKPDIQTAVGCFISELKLDEYSLVFSEKTLLVMDVLKYDNLRSVRQALFHIKEILIILKSQKQNEKYISLLVEFFLVVFFQKCTDEIKVDDISSALYAYSSKKMKLVQYLDNEDQKEDSVDTMYREQFINNSI